MGWALTDGVEDVFRIRFDWFIAVSSATTRDDAESVKLKRERVCMRKGTRPNARKSERVGNDVLVKTACEKFFTMVWYAFRWTTMASIRMGVHPFAIIPESEMKSVEISREWNGSSWATFPPALQSLIQDIRERLRLELPSVPYYTRDELANLIRVTVKTLANDQSPSGAQVYPVAVRMGGRCVYPRHDVLDWLAQREVEGRMRRVHRCR